MIYRREIDGLRSIAVLPVMLFHAGVAWLPGGFAGVDVFFVLSGYLITNLVYFDLQDGRFSLWSFYERRMRRILPALIVVIAATMAMTWLWMVPTRLAEFGNSVLAVAAFISNLYFWKSADYFAPDAELQPLLHTWSLAVEEQFYIAFPALFYLLYRFARRWTLPALVVAAIVSLGLAQFGKFNLPETRFYLTHTRAWELLLGASLAIAMAKLPPPRQTLSNVLSTLGVAMVIAAMLLLNREMKVPGAVVLLPTVGTALVIAFAHGGTFTGKFLASPVPVGIGLISYSAYLWHQPLLAMARIREQGEPPLLFMLALCVLALVLAYLTWLMIEQPFRNRGRVKRPLFFTVIGAGLTTAVGLAWLLVEYKGFEGVFLSRFDGKSRVEYALVLEAINGEDRESLYDDGACKFSTPDIDDAFLARFKGCVAKHGPATLIIGDSHAMDLFNAVAQASKYPFIAGVLKESCNPGPRRDARCPYRNITALAKESPASLKHVILTLSGDHFAADATGSALREDNVEHVVKFIRDLPTGLSVVWLGPQLEPGLDLRDINPLFPKEHRPNPQSMERMAHVDRLLAKALSAAQGVRYISKINLIKFDAATEFVSNGRYAYSDTHHWSIFGEKLFGPRIVAGLRQQGLAGL